MSFPLNASFHSAVEREGEQSRGAKAGEKESKRAKGNDFPQEEKLRFLPSVGGMEQFYAGIVEIPDI